MLMVQKILSVSSSIEIELLDHSESSDLLKSSWSREGGLTSLGSIAMMR